VRKANKITTFSTSHAIVENLEIMHVHTTTVCSYEEQFLLELELSHSVLTLRGTDASVVRISEDAPR
jgi:hypothetical protein